LLKKSGRKKILTQKEKNIQRQYQKKREAVASLYQALKMKKQLEIKI